MLTLMGALGTLVYTRIMFKRPPITETGERTRLLEKANHPQVQIEEETGMVEVKPFTFNIPNPPTNPNEDSDHKKSRFANIGFSIEIRDANDSDRFEGIRPQFMDEMLQLLGKKSFFELASVQGRFIIRTQILELVNKMMKEEYATNVYFTKLLVQ